ncbi:MAG: NADH-quinone oxidoreductase subunit M [Candidatus Heimdallarchaeota archaeon]|nr:NADH-quinone oxidoreductase subunit M [Candidatus Heimdallarchaeota archaeon]
MNDWALSLLLLLPIISSIFVYLLDKRNLIKAKFLATGIITATTIFSIVLWFTEFVPSDRLARAADSDGFLLHFQADWIPSVGITYAVGVDGLSMPLVVLTQVVFLVSVISSFYVHEDEGAYYSLLLVLLSGVMGTFIALDLFLFYIAWELVLIPMFFLIRQWGGPNRKYASIKFFIYTHLASLVMLIGLFMLYLNVDANSFYLPDLKAGMPGIDVKTLQLIFWLVFVGFVTKFPQVPVHTWLPDAHVQAPSPGSAILAGLLLKMGGYGLMRIGFWLFADTGFFLTEEGKTVRVIIAWIGVVSMVYPALIALQQDDLKKMIAYSSISHMGIVLLGLAAYNPLGFNAAMYMMIAHGVISPGLFLLSGIIEHNTKSHTRDISKVGGLAHKMPFTGGLFVFLGFASAGLPGLAGFVAEFNAFVAMFDDTELLGGPWKVIPIIAVMSVIITAGYYLWAIERVIYKQPTEELENTKPGKWYEVWPVFILSVFTLVLGLFPAIVWWVLDEFSTSLL